MAEHTTPLAATIDAFNHARGEALDSQWAYGASWRLLRRDVEPAQVDEGLREALALVERTQESPEDLFGDPSDHADALYDRWVEEGRLHLWDPSSMSWREVPSWGLGMGAFYSVAFMVVFLARGESSRDWTLGMVVIPIGIGVMKAVAWATWDTVLRRRGPFVALGGMAASVLASAVVIAGINEWGRTRPFGEASVWWYLWIALVSGLAASAVGRWVESLPTPEPDDFTTLDAWSAELAGILRGSYHLSEARVRTIIGEAHDHAVDAGRTLQEEFGTPAEYAAGFAPDRSRRNRIEAGFWAVSGLLQAAWLLDDFGWLRTAVVLGCLAVAWARYRRTD